MSKVVRTHLAHGGTKLNQPKAIVVHAMAEIVDDGADSFYAWEFLEKYKLSAHSLITPNGTNIRCRLDTEVAWHARGHNTDTLGIEFLVPGRHTYATFLEALKNPYLSGEQYEAGLQQIREWMELYNIDSVVRHCDLSPGRKVDPGIGFPWERLRHNLGLQV